MASAGHARRSLTRLALSSAAAREALAFLIMTELVSELCTLIRKHFSIGDGLIMQGASSALFKGVKKVKKKKNTEQKGGKCDATV